MLEGDSTGFGYGLDVGGEGEVDLKQYPWVLKKPVNRSAVYRLTDRQTGGGTD